MRPQQMRAREIGAHFTGSVASPADAVFAPPLAGPAGPANTIGDDEDTQDYKETQGRSAYQDISKNEPRASPE